MTGESGQGTRDVPEDVDRACGGDDATRSRLVAAEVAGLTRFVDLRLESALRRRMDPADVVQQALLEAARRFPEWCAARRPPFRVWLRLLTAQSLAEARRRHLGSLKRDAQRELAPPRPLDTESVARFVAASQTTPSGAAHRRGVVEAVARALDELGEVDRLVLVLRHFERLSNDEAAAELGLEPAAASKRFVRAMGKLRPVLERLGLLG